MLGMMTEVKKYIPEWPNITRRARCSSGMDEGGDHPFGHWS
jgi:hypothetical protein